MKRKVFNAVCLLSLVLISTRNAFGNGLNIANLSVNQAAQTVTFDISWNNSWRDSENWDGAWIFVKWRQCNVPLATTWSHGLISTTLTDHTFPAIFEPTLSDGTAPGIDASPNNTGVMIRRTNTGFGTVSGTITLRVTNLPTTGDYDFRVFGIEMVFIPQGNFWAGDQASNHFIRTSSSDNAPIQITTENGFAISFNGGGNINLQNDFRKGFSAFYIMKYEISQGQYTDFLNTLGQTQASNRFPNAFNTNRNRVTVNPLTFVYSCDRPDRSMNYLDWRDTWAYLDWAALRPLTELEYEKACRGPLAPIPYEYAWGSTTYTFGTTLSGTEDGTETYSAPAGANAKAFNSAVTGGDAGTGPVRVGIFATSSTTTRQAAGASYWGVLNLSDNLTEDYFMIHASTTGNTLGDGILDANGNNNTAGWTVTDDRIIIRGMMNTTTPADGSISARPVRRDNYNPSGWWLGDYYHGRRYFTGGRGGR